MTSTLYVDNLIEKTSGNGVHIPGHVIQVQQRVTTVNVNTTSSSWSATDLFVQITPKFSSSKILVSMTGGMNGWAGSNTTYDQKGGIKIYKSINGGSFTQVESSSSGQQVIYGRGGEYDAFSISFLDSPSTTSAVIYKTYFRRESGSLTFSANRDSSNQTQATAMEIAQ
jgi:hypothetical protein